MTAHTAYLTFETAERREFVRITDEVQAAVDESGIAEGMVLVSAMHITAGVWINDDEPGHPGRRARVARQAGAAVLAAARQRRRPPSSHPTPATTATTAGGEDNGDAHLKNLLVHHQVIVPVTDGTPRPRAVAGDLLLRVRRPPAKRLVIKVLGE